MQNNKAVLSGVKLIYNDDTYPVESIPKDMEKLIRLVKEQITELANSNIKIKYYDDENELVVLKTDQKLAEILKEAKSKYQKFYVQSVNNINEQLALSKASTSNNNCIQNQQMQNNSFISDDMNPSFQQKQPNGFQQSNGLTQQQQQQSPNQNPINCQQPMQVQQPLVQMQQQQQPFIFNVNNAGLSQNKVAANYNNYNNCQQFQQMPNIFQDQQFNNSYFPSDQLNLGQCPLIPNTYDASKLYNQIPVNQEAAVNQGSNMTRINYQMEPVLEHLNSTQFTLDASKRLSVLQQNSSDTDFKNQQCTCQQSQLEGTQKCCYCLAQIKNQKVIQFLLQQIISSVWPDQRDFQGTNASNSNQMLTSQISMAPPQLLQQSTQPSLNKKPSTLSLQKSDDNVFGLTKYPRESTNKSVSNYSCNGCNKKISGLRFKCTTCQNFDFCEICEKSKDHPHVFLKIKHVGAPMTELKSSQKPNRQTQSKDQTLQTNQLQQPHKQNQSESSKSETQSTQASIKIDELCNKKDLIFNFDQNSNSNNEVKENQLIEVKSSNNNQLVVEKKSLLSAQNRQSNLGGKPQYRVSYLNEKQQVYKEVVMGNKFIAKIQIQNTGKEKWPENTFIKCIKGLYKDTDMKVQVVSLNPQQMGYINLNLQAPNDTKEESTVWRLMHYLNEEEMLFGQSLDIVVYPREGPVEKLPENQIMNTTSNAETIIKNKDHPVQGMGLYGDYE